MSLGLCLYIDAGGEGGGVSPQCWCEGDCGGGRKGEGVRVGGKRRNEKLILYIS